MSEFKNILREPWRWQRYHIDRTAPHPLYVMAEGDRKTAVMLVMQGSRSRDFALNANALAYMVDGLRNGHIAEGFIALSTNGWEPCAHASVTEVAARCANMPPINGRWGPYFWLDDKLQPVTNAARDQAPW